MSITKRQNQILELVSEHGFLTVARLSELIYTSPSSVRRDLARLQNLSLIKRTHGGVSTLGDLGQPVPFESRMTKNVGEKRHIAALAATLLADGQAVMLDGSTTAGFLVPHIAKHKDMILFTNNMLTAISAVRHGVRTHVIGGQAIDGSAVLSGEEAYRVAAKINPDILFFSSGSLGQNGMIYDPIPEENHMREIMLRNAATRVFLCDSGKFGGRALYTLCSVDEVDACVFDKEFPRLKARCRILY